MSKYLAIEQALQRCAEGQFEKVVGQLLNARGVRGLSLSGSVIGKHKTRTGVPDAFSTTSGERFTLVAATTLADSNALRHKLHEDIDCCADSGRTGVPVDHVDRLILAFNSVLAPGVVLEVAEYARQKGLQPEFLSLTELAQDIARRYPWIARDEFGIPIDTGQILSIDAFIEAYDRGKLATPLSTPFHFRSELLDRAMAAIANADLLISGRAGIGKSRLALEIARRCEQAGLCVRCILTAHQPLHEDIARHFSEPRDYLVMIDDANRVNGLEYLLRTALDPLPGRSIRFVLTARDYARDQCHKALMQLGRGTHEITLQPFTRDETDAYVADAFGIVNSDYQRQIWQLSRGNARLATMAARQAIMVGRLDAIRNVLDLYEAYFDEIVLQLDRTDPRLLRVLALVGLFRVVLADDNELIEALELQFGLRAGLLWEAVDRLHTMECVDLHGQRIAKCSDQVLAAYAFYLCFVRRRDLSFAVLLSHFAAKHLGKIRDAVYGALGTMDGQLVLGAIRPGCERAIRDTSGDLQLRLLDTFWFVEPDLALAKAAESLLSGACEAAPMQFAEKASLHDDPRLRILARFHSDQDRHAIALGYALDYALHAPAHAGRVLSLIGSSNGFGVDRYSHAVEYEQQRQVLAELEDRSRGDPRLQPLLAAYLPISLATEVEANYSEGDRFVLSQIPLQACEGLAKWRAALWQALRVLVDLEDSRPLGLTALWEYARGCLTRHPAGGVLALDVAPLTSLFQSGHLSPDSFENCRLIRAIAQRMARAGIDGLESLAADFQCDEMRLLDLVTLDLWSLADVETDYETLMQRRKKRVIDTYGALDASTLPQLLALWGRVGTVEQQDQHDLQLSLRLLLDSIGEADPQRLASLTAAYLAQGAVPDVIGTSWTSILVRRCGRKVAWQVIDSHDFPTRAEWLLAFYLALPSQDVTIEDAEVLTGIAARPGAPPLWAHWLRPYIVSFPGFLLGLLESLLDWPSQDGGSGIRALLEHLDDELLEAVRTECAARPDTLVRAYLAANAATSANSHFDHSAALLDAVLELSPSFLAKYVQAQANGERWLSKWTEQHRNYERLWARPDWLERFHELVGAVATLGDTRSGNYLAAWLPNARHGEATPLKSQHLELLLKYIRLHAGDSDEMQVLFAGLVEIPAPQRLRAFEAFLGANQGAEDFARLELLPHHWGGTGSLVPVMEARVGFLEKVAELLKGPWCLPHRLHVMEAVRRERWHVDAEVEREFASDGL